ncbi:MAG TPA: hypothetical protein VJT73_11495 [Polyangiaceae bacterium]|nr:hypothetical protein [Polyangiaceae bacterium]
MRASRLALGFRALVIVVGAGAGARAEGPPSEGAAKTTDATLLRTVVISARPADKALRDAPLVARAHQLDLILSDAVQDLGLTLDLSEPLESEEAELADIDLIARATKSRRLVVYPSIDARGSELVVRLVVATPGSKVALVRTEAVKVAELAVRAVVMLRDVMAVKTSPASPEGQLAKADRPVPPAALVVPARSAGRFTLAFNSALFGGFVGYSVQRGSGSDDPRLLFPLLALGTGVGLGASAIIAEEWDVGLGDAWYLSAAAWWPALSGLALARSRQEVDPPTEYGFAVVGALSGLGLATTSLVLGGGMSQGGALLTHSGGAVGTLLGGLTEVAVRGDLEGATPFRGIGYGAAAGVLLAGTLAVKLDIEPSRVLVIDLGAGLGGLAGAAVTSPFIFRERTPAGDRSFVLATMGGAVAGGVAAWLWSGRSSAAKADLPFAAPYAGVIATSTTPSGRTEPALGIGVSGALP